MGNKTIVDKIFILTFFLSLTMMSCSNFIDLNSDLCEINKTKCDNDNNKANNNYINIGQCVLVKTIRNNKHRISKLLFSTKNNNLLMVGYEWASIIELWDISKTKLLHIFSDHRSDIRDIAVDHSGLLMISGSLDATGRAYDLESNAAKVYPMDSAVFGVAIHPNGSLAFALSNFSIKIIHKDQSNPTTLLGHMGCVESVSFNKSGEILASSSWDKNIMLWDTKTNKLLKTLKGHTDIVKKIIFDPSDRYLASASYDRTVKLWDIKAGVPIFNLKGHKDRVVDVSFSPTSNILASASYDGTVKLWNLNNSKIIEEMKGHEFEALSVAFDRSGKKIATGSGNGMIKLWECR